MTHGVPEGVELSPYEQELMDRGWPWTQVLMRREMAEKRHQDRPWERKLFALPARFYYDHRGRDLPSGKIIRSGSRLVLVELDHESYDDLLADAQHYIALGVEEFGLEYLGLITSARATVRKLLGAY